MLRWIYAQSLADMGAANVTGVDFSEKMLKTAWELSQEYVDACKTGLPHDSLALAKDLKRCVEILPLRFAHSA